MFLSIELFGWLCFISSGQRFSISAASAGTITLAGLALSEAAAIFFFAFIFPAATGRAEARVSGRRPEGVRVDLAGFGDHEGPDVGEGGLVYAAQAAAGRRTRSLALEAVAVQTETF